MAPATSDTHPVKWTRPPRPSAAARASSAGRRLAVADDRQVDAGQVGHGVQQRGQVLDRHQAADRADQGDVRGRGRGGPGARRRGPATARYGDEVEAERDDLVLRRPADPQVEQLVADLGADRHQHVGAAGQPPLHLDERPLPPTGGSSRRARGRGRCGPSGAGAGGADERGQPARPCPPWPCGCAGAGRRSRPAGGGRRSPPGRRRPGVAAGRGAGGGRARRRRRARPRRPTGGRRRGSSGTRRRAPG